MKKLLALSLLLAAMAVSAMAQYPFYSIKQLQQVPAESLSVADTLTNFATSNTAQPRWTLQTSRRRLDTISTVGIVVVPPGLITYTAGIWTMLLYDTAASNTSWGGMLLRINALADTTALKLGGFLNVNPGDIITLTGVISEFPDQRGFSTTQLAPLAGKPITIIGNAPLPKPIVKNVGDFYTGLFSSGKIQFSTGEPMEGMYVELRNVTVNNKVNTARGTFSVVDALGNEISEYDWSRYFTLGHGTSQLPPYPADTNWAKTYAAMGNGLRIDTLRGVITTASGSEGPRGYRISPIYPRDIVFTTNPVPPLVSTHRRTPVVVTPNDSATIGVKVTKQTNGSTPTTVSLLYSVNTGAFSALPMSFRTSDTTYVAVIPKQVANTVVRYFVQVADSFGQVVRYANSSTNTGIAADTSKGFFFYTSLNRPLTIQDVQLTPFTNGRSAYLGAVTSLSGIITGDTAHIALSPVTTGSTNAWYMQSTNQPWSGIWLTTADTTTQKLMAALRNGDSVTVTGTVQEQFDVTRLGNITAVTKVSGGNPEPAPVVLPTGTFAVGNGVRSAEQYEGMLVKFNDVTVTDLNPTFSDDTEYNVKDNTSSPLVVQWSGKYTYSNRAADASTGKTILTLGTKIGSLTGIVYYSFNQYKIVPRTNTDFVGVNITSVAERSGSAVPASYELTQNYPNPFNPSTMIQYGLPTGGMTTLKVYNVLGQEVATLVNDIQAPGTYTVRFDASSLSSGVYFFRVQSGSFNAVKRMMLLK